MVFFLGLLVLGDGNIVIGWIEMMDYVCSVMNVGVDGYVYGVNYMFYWIEVDLMY